LKIGQSSRARCTLIITIRNQNNLKIENGLQMNIPNELKIIIAISVLWIITHIAAYPGTTFAKWGIRKFKSYPTFIDAITLLFAFPIFIASMYWIIMLMYKK
jgi:hypothetical protein